MKTIKPLSKNSKSETKSSTIKGGVTSKASAASKAAAAVKSTATKVAKKSRTAPVSQGVGRRKSSVARVWLRTGKGSFMVNGKDVLSYFDTEVSRAHALAPWKHLPHLTKEYDIEVNVNGGGIHSQAGAVKLGIARAVTEIRQETRDILRSEGLLTVDSRIKERKKYGQLGARRKFQFVKR